MVKVRMVVEIEVGDQDGVFVDPKNWETMDPDLTSALRVMLAEAESVDIFEATPKLLAPNHITQMNTEGMQLSDLEDAYGGIEALASIFNVMSVMNMGNVHPMKMFDGPWDAYWTCKHGQLCFVGTSQPGGYGDEIIMVMDYDDLLIV